MTPLPLLALVALSVLAIASAKGMKWKLLNLLIILAFMGLGLLIGWGMGMWGKNMEIGALVAIPLACLLGAVGALGCWRRNKRRAKANIVTG
jgi:hypothetical protein